MVAPGFASVPLFGREPPSASRRPGSPAILRGGAALGGAVSLHLLLLLVSLRAPAEAPAVSPSVPQLQEISISFSGSSAAQLSAAPSSAAPSSAAPSSAAPSSAAPSSAAPSSAAPSSAASLRAATLNAGPSMPAALNSDLSEATGALEEVGPGAPLDGGTSGALAGGLGNGQGRGDSSGDSGGDKAQKAAQKAKLVRSRTCDDLFPWDATGERETVTVQLLVPASGVPKVHRVLSASSEERGFVKAAEVCSNRLRFEPARDEKGRTIATKATVRLRFERGAT